MTAWLKLLVAAGIVLGVVLTGLGMLARVLPALDIVNNGFLAVLIGAVGVLCLALVVREARLIVPAVLLVVANVFLLFAGLEGAAPTAAGGSERFLRIATFNLLFRNDRIDGAAEFLTETDADVVVLQEATRPHLLELREKLKTLYPHGVGEFGVAILSKYPIKADGRVDRPGYPEWIRLLARWIEIDVKGTPIEVVGVHVARPFYPELQQQDVTTLTGFLKNRQRPLVVAGDFNMTPWTNQQQRFTQATGLGRYNTFIFTWPMRWRKYPFMPLFPIDNVFASPAFAKIGAWGGWRLGSDHRPLIADIALVQRTTE